MGKIKNVLIVSPHSDDALFSCAHALLNEGFEATVLTVENDPRRIKEDEELYKFIDKTFYHLNVEFIDNSYYSFYKDNKKRDIEEADVYHFLREYFGSKKIDEIRDQVISFVKKFKKKNPDCQIIVPLGIAHPFHFFIHDILTPYADLFYREFPHSYKRKAQPQMERVIDSFCLHKTYPTKEIHDIKFELARKFYKSQSGLLWFEQGYIKKQLSEEIYVKREN